jgi:DNA primase
MQLVACFRSRGIDLILEEGMNVRFVLTLMEDPDSFAKKTSYDDLVAILKTMQKILFSLKRHFDERGAE